jgi:hypothetical protein
LVKAGGHLGWCSNDWLAFLDYSRIQDPVSESLREADGPGLSSLKEKQLERSR